MLVLAALWFRCLLLDGSGKRAAGLLQVGLGFASSFRGICKGV